MKEIKFTTNYEPVLSFSDKDFKTKYEELKKRLQQNKKISYPSIPKLCKNERYARLVYDSLGGKEGELTATTQYIYEHIELKEKTAISSILRDIAIEEMHHLNLLGEIIMNSGEKPIYQSSEGKIWSAHNVRYDIKDIKEMMRINKKAEEEAIKGYRNIMRYTNNIYLRRVYERIILDETTHWQIFDDILKSM